MSDDLPMEKPPGRLTRPGSTHRAGPVAARGPRPDAECGSAPGESGVAHAWNRGVRLWDGYYAVVWVATLVLTLASSQPSHAVRVTSGALFALLAPWYVWGGGRELMALAQDSRRAGRYLTGAGLLFLPAAALAGEMRLAAFALVPQCFMLLPTRPALIAVTAMNIGPVAGWALLWRPDGRELFFQALFAVVTLAFSAVFGSWITRIIEQSEERAALIAELEASREEIARLSAERGALAEHERLSREIHDTLAQGFTSLLMLVQAVDSELERDLPQARRHLELMAATARQNLAEARALVAGGAPADLDGGSLPDALRRLAARHGPTAAVKIAGSARPLPAALEVVALRTCQEALANVTKHAGPDAGVTISLDYGETELRLSVRDTGRGFDASAPLAGYGLNGLHARAAEVGGSAEVVSAPGRGAAVSIRLPAPERRPPEPVPASADDRSRP
ncbi:sensor histidine kinase [Streptomyces sp. MUM 178J]|uniref:sensor histidine kinase n=1 Tax=Streptomyces sp. MUM 178J TaxID=2791991 RepID=UPI001F0460A3|nr:sensor histidine kinase [Streptomyces sp. MUM 178J]WRQ78498.1 sensor histidine kinase [Streptomyces sp. MUM 178J]